LEQELKLSVQDLEVSALALIPDGAQHILALGHGAGAGMRHHAMAEIARTLGDVQVATLRYNFPYMDSGRKVPDARPLLYATVRSAVQLAKTLLPEAAVFAGGKSFGGRMTSTAESLEPLNISGLVFYGFPLHPAGKPGVSRAEHLFEVKPPMLFLQGTKDALAEPELLKPVVAQLPTAAVHWIDGADHSFHVPKSTGKTDVKVLEDLAKVARDWMAGLTS
jgi:predicted alpha/beta-hydrolase family hydrolase